MLLALFALLSALGSWAAWRRNPMYSTRSTLRGVLGVLLMIAALVAALVGVVNLAQRYSKTVALAIIFSFVIVASIAMILGIMAMTAPKVATLPPTVTMLHFHRKKLGLWAKRWVVSMLVMGVLALALPGATKAIAYALGAILGLLGIVMMVAGYFAAKNQDRMLTALEYQPWVHWQYSPAQWAAWTDAQVARAKAIPPAFNWRRHSWKIGALWLVIAAGTFILGLGWIYALVYATAILALMVLILSLGARSERHSPETLRKKMERWAPEVFLGEEGVFCDGVLTPWVSTDDWLLEAILDEGLPRHLLLQFEKINAGNASIPTSRLEWRVPLPEAAEADLARLQKELKAKVPTAKVQIY
jgi:hypothetical protein